MSISLSFGSLFQGDKDFVSGEPYAFLLGLGDLFRPGFGDQFFLLKGERDLCLFPDNDCLLWGDGDLRYEPLSFIANGDLDLLREGGDGNLLNGERDL